MNPFLENNMVKRFKAGFAVRLFVVLLIALSFGLLVKSVVISDFRGLLTPEQEGQLFGRLTALLIVSFAACGGLAFAAGAMSGKKKERGLPASEAAAAFPDEEQEEAAVPILHTAEPREEAKDAVQTTAAFAPAERDQSIKLLADAAGEVRTSVEVIEDELQDLQDEAAPDDQQRIDSLYDETDRIRKILGGMEELAKARAAGHSLVKQPVELQPYLAAVIARVRGAVEGKDITFNLECAPDLVLSADRELLHKVMVNLLDNAEKSITKTGSVAVTAEQKENEILLTVQDSGGGIRSRDFSHIFEPFYRGAGRGLGLGLSIAKELVVCHGGTIDVKTAPGKGSRFTVHFPAA